MTDDGVETPGVETAGGRVDERHRWYDLFSRGARDWLRHNAKLRQAVRDRMPELVAGADVLSRPSDRTVQVPVRFLEHYRFRLRDANEEEGVGQGEAKPGDVLGAAVAAARARAARAAAVMASSASCSSSASRNWSTGSGRN